MSNKHPTTERTRESDAAGVHAGRRDGRRRHRRRGQRHSAADRPTPKRWPRPAATTRTWSTARWARPACGFPPSAWAGTGNASRPWRPRPCKGDNWLGASLNDEDFKKNRRDVVTRCIESGINYIDACTKSEVLTYAEALRGRRDKMYPGLLLVRGGDAQSELPDGRRPARDPGKGHEGGQARVRRSLADHDARAERHAHPGRSRGDDEGPRKGPQAGQVPVHGASPRTTARTSSR